MGGGKCVLDNDNRSRSAFLGVGAANSTSIFGHKNNRQTMYLQHLEN